MKSSHLATATILGALAFGCSPDSELAAAKQRIAQLEAELASIKAKSPTPNDGSELNSGSPQTNPSGNPAGKSDTLGKQWIYDAREDKMTGGKTYTAYVLSTNTVNFHSPYSGEQNARLLLRTDPKYGRDVMFSIERGQLLCRSYEDTTILVRFDDGKPERFSAVGPADNSSDLAFIRNYDKFLTKLKSSKIVRISINVYQEGSPVFEFDVSGFDHSKYIPKK